MSRGRDVYIQDVARKWAARRKHKNESEHFELSGGEDKHRVNVFQSNQSHELRYQQWAKTLK